MKKIVYVCNCCRKEIKGDGTRLFFDFFDTEKGEPLDNSTVPDNDVHFCARCSGKIMKDLFLEPEIPSGKREKDGSGKADPEKPKVDTGKIMALHNASWSNKEIAEEMGMTERQVYQCIYYQKRKGEDTDGAHTKEL